jgi:hypothetical protein
VDREPEGTADTVKGQCRVSAIAVMGRRNGSGWSPEEGTRPFTPSCAHGSRRSMSRRAAIRPICPRGAGRLGRSSSAPSNHLARIAIVGPLLHHFATLLQRFSPGLGASEWSALHVRELSLDDIVWQKRPHTAIDQKAVLTGRQRGFGGPWRTPVDDALERVKGIEPSYEAWEAAVLPLNYTRGRANSKARPWCDAAGGELDPGRAGSEAPSVAGLPRGASPALAADTRRGTRSPGRRRRAAR